MQTENDTSKAEESPKQEAGEGCSVATCYADYMLPETVPRDRKIMGFFEDFGWYPAAWSADDAVWKAAKCVGLQGVRGEEPEWNEVSFNDADLCWWREWPSNRWEDNPYHNSYGADYGSARDPINEKLATAIKILDESPRLLRATAFGLVNPKAQICSLWFRDPSQQRALSHYLNDLADSIEETRNSKSNSQLK